MKECLDEATLQGYFDGELPGAAAERAAAHLAACVTCAEAAREMQSEMSLLSTALQTEFDVGVPTERLRRRIEGAIAESQVEKAALRYSASSSDRSWLRSVGDLLSPRALGYAALAAIVAVTFSLGVIYLKRGRVTSGVEIARKDVPPKTANPQSSPELSTATSTKTPSVVATVVNAPKKIRQRHSTRETDRTAKLFPGEQAYIKTIAALNATIKSDVRPMRPGLQVEYEHNLAVLNQAIAATRVVAQRNPNDPDAAQFMFSAYQSKVDLLTQVADARLFNTQRR
ncbi:MAG TPA: zf-HC2 domain-containing protein [Pyrinomonadaceae bacterium]|nr:zf-HC2 domain-containing protein [Pyrinomonadaceae bacterium]